jgi:large subunit ribosomal protein L35
MPKMKTQSAAKKRFRLTGTGKVVRRKAFKSHLLEKKSPKRKRGFRKMAEVHEADAQNVLRLLGKR